ncbi:MAG: hypothetical protein HYS12_24190, partial [Planctomycetes bacterium]|nr:hypothetical protein [Planctomycetota bacterium]
MADRLKLEYHQTTFSLLNEEPLTAISNRRKIERWENNNGTRLPASIREWYSLEGSEDRLHSGTAEDFRPLSLQKALNRLSRARQDGRALLANRLEIGYWESGAVSYVRLDRSADPPVDLGLDLGFCKVKPRTVATWNGIIVCMERIMSREPQVSNDVFLVPRTDGSPFH